MRFPRDRSPRPARWGRHPAAQMGGCYARAVSGIVAIISHDRTRPALTADFQGLIEAYEALRGRGHVQRVSVGDWCHVALVHGIVPGRLAREDGSWLAAVGALHGPAPISLARDDQLDGQFAAVRYDAAQDELRVLSDPFGMQALYVAQRDGRTYASTSSIALARHLATPPDPLGMKLFLRAGYLFGPQTQWQGIERLGPARAVAFTARGTRHSTYWLPQVDERVRGMSLEETVDHCVEIGLDTARRRLRARHPVWTDLTGGFDSRLVAGLLTRVGQPFWTSTNGGDTSPDVVLAREVARAGGYPWRHFRPPALEPSLADAALAWGDGSLDVFQLAEVLALHETKRADASVVVTGGGGEHASARPWVQELWRAGRSREVDFSKLLDMRYLHPLDLSMLADDPGPAVEAYMRQVLGERARLFATQPNTTKLDAIYAYKSTGHFGAYRSASEALLRQEIPFYFRDFFSACFSADYRWRNGHRLQRGMIDRASPQTAPVPTTLGGPAQPLRLTNAYRFAPYYTRATRVLARKLREGLRPPPAPGPAADTWARRAPIVQRLREHGVLDPRELRSAELYDRPGLTAFFVRAEQPGFSEWKLLGRVATLELALRAAEATSSASPALELG
jgi:hypothetical protein